MTADLQDAKALVLAHYAALDRAAPHDVAEILARRTHADWHWRGYHPFHEQHGAAAVAGAFWAPYLHAMSRLRRRQDIFFAGRNAIDGGASVWTVSMGHLMGLHDGDFLGIPPTRRIAMLRYAEFNRVEDGRITETAFFCDLLHLMRQAGVHPLPPQTGAHLVQPGPATHDGLLFGAADPAEGAETLALIDEMVGHLTANSNGPGGWTPRDPNPQAELRHTWSEEMIWWGPEGIGATYTIDRYIEQHQRPFRTRLRDRVGHGHVAKLAEGSYGGFFGWPNLSVTPMGGYMGLPAGPRADMRVIDIYRREGMLLAENWVFIDILHFLNMQGLDVLGRMAQVRGDAGG